ncbi:MAG: DUF3488 domain-containing protein, partial [Bacteriovoracaceae bacterium]|nr:DUF3488 domain-containing protein [Bacteriovoracaceae bacterium]
MRPKNRSVLYLTLIPAPWFCLDFLPPWFAPLFSIYFLLRIFISIPTLILVPGSIGLSYLAFKESNFRLAPEAAISILNIMLASKFGQKSSSFRTQVILGFLWIGSLALFNNNLYYLLYILGSGIILTGLIKLKEEQRFRFRTASPLDILKSVGRALPLVLILFFAFPRFRGFLPTANTETQQSGYSKSVNNSNASSLSLSDKTAFYAQTDKELSPEVLYWRGRTHETTDGYNWRKARLAHSSLPVHSAPNKLVEYQLKYEQDFGGDMVLMDTPIKIQESNLRYYRNNQSNTFKSYSVGKKAQINAVSHPTATLRSKLGSSKKTYLKLPGFMPKSFRDLFDPVETKDVEALIDGFRSVLQGSGFKYSLTPGPMPTLSDFINKRVGFCGHYASLLGTFLRYKGVPSRLVSGFQGGVYNPSGGFYTIKNKDAHVWVEYHDGEFWKRVDPTGFVSPERINAGVQGLNQDSEWMKTNRFYSSFLQARAVFENINYKLALFFDNYDKEAQKLLAASLSLELKAFYYASALLLIVTCIFFYLSIKGRRIKRNEEDIYFERFVKKLKKKKVMVDESMNEQVIINRCL